MRAVKRRGYMTSGLFVIKIDSLTQSQTKNEESSDGVACR